ncbi:hypothetical protein [Ferruginibacter sp. SUN106]|uniref:hypothetical protein n=1 Tax=Ferruginibacter sp. SUN106 TaxID=2978348 RepID=UPI003D367815
MKILLLILLGFIALTALISGLILISHPDGGILQIQLSVLSSTPFKNFLIPGIILTMVVGSINLLALICCFIKYRKRYNWAMAGGVVICGWIIIQMLLINTIHWLQFVYLGAGLLVILIAYQLKGKWAV